MDTPYVVVGDHWTFETLSTDWTGSTLRVGERRRSMVVDIEMPGQFQVENAAVALAALNQADKAGIPVTRQGRLEGLEKARWPGRLEVVSEVPRIVLDGAHNPYSILRLVESVNGLLDPVSSRPERRPVVIFGCMADKDIESMLKTLLPVAYRIVFTAAQRERAANPDDLLQQAVALRGDHPLPELSAVPGVEAAVEQQRDLLEPLDTLLITGSLAVVGEARRLLVPDDGDASDKMEI